MRPTVAAAPTLHTEAALALAVVASSATPLVLLDGDLHVIALSKSFCRAFSIDLASAPGRKLSELGAGEWDVHQLRSLLRATVAGHADVEAYEMDLVRRGREPRRLVLNAHVLDYGDPEHVRLLLAAADVTDARRADKLKDDLLREKAIMLQELQHRVANSLQIIASVLMQSANQATSDDLRTGLYDAHNRVMSVASVQKQLAASRLGEVGLRVYFADLCESIGASMIRDHKQLSLEVTTDESVASADVSVSLGLIITELVINALKHAFPGRRQGKIIVGYHSAGPAWTLSVGDNGVGMPKDTASSKPGLGTSIVGALAQQLEARVRVANAKPGTTVSIIHA
jgi:two-component system, sensor histidine kinase PdtaS